MRWEEGDLSMLKATDLTSPLRESLEWINTFAMGAHDPWWIVFSGAAHLVGAWPATPADVDLMMSVRDANAFANATGSLPFTGPPPSGSFRSKVFMRFEQSPIPVEVMADFEVHTEDGWTQGIPETCISCAGVFVPSIADQIRIYRLLNRSKDKAIIEALAKRLTR